MATQKPISTINYCSENFTRAYLQRLVDSHIIQFALYICHKGEDGDKDHMHLFVFPNQRLDPMNLKDELREPDPDPNQKKLLGTLAWQHSVPEDWLLYAYHNKTYLMLHEELSEATSKIEYDLLDIKVIGDFDIEALNLRAITKMKKGFQGIYAQLVDGVPPEKLIERGYSPTLIGQILNATKLTKKSIQEELYKTIGKLLSVIDDRVVNELNIPDWIFDDIDFLIDKSKKVF